MGATRPWTVILDAALLGRPDLGTIDMLVRLQLAARRAGGVVLLRDEGDELRDLIGLVGLAGVLLLEADGQSEEREQALGVEEEGELGDLAGG